jgi:septal ring factor EnvC (AmiA/AmiB activator)
MLSSTNVRKINDQIERELRDVNSIVTSNEDKIAALDRIARLKALLNPQPSRSDILSELASAFVEAQRTPPPTPADNFANALADIFRR